MIHRDSYVNDINRRRRDSSPYPESGRNEKPEHFTRGVSFEDTGLDQDSTNSRF